MVQHDTAGAGVVSDQVVAQTEQNALALNMLQNSLFNVSAGVTPSVDLGANASAGAPQAFCAADPQSVLGQNLTQVQAQLQVPLQEQLPLRDDMPVMSQSGLQAPTLAGTVEDQMLYNHH